MHSISAVIITKNEERNIRRCLESLIHVADEIIVVDDFSADGTISVCLEYGVKVISQNWLGFGAQKNTGNNAASHDYILSLDADEALDQHLREAISNEKERGLQGAYRLSRLNYYYGKFIRHGLEFPDEKIRLFNRTQASWQSQLVHETLQISSSVNTTHLNGFLRHYTYYRFEEHILKANKYTTLAALHYFRQGRKYALFKLIFSPVFTFIQAYIVKLGFLEGIHGFVLAAMNANAAFVKYVKLWELHRHKDQQHEE
ncbi:MAG: glycosyltransferase family 2 protein [Chitinophagaceae bacterium]